MTATLIKTAGWRAMLLAATLTSAAALPASAEPPPADKITVAVSILPQAYFVERIGGENVDVLVLVGPGQSPHSYDPTPRQIATLSKARVYFRIGVEFESIVMPRVRRMFPDMRVIDLRAGLKLRDMTEEHGHDHDHGHSHDDEHQPADEDDHDAEDGDYSGKDPHTWLSPLMAKAQARAVADALSDLDPAHSDVYQRSLQALQRDLDELHRELAEVLAPVKGQDVLVFHPAYGYFLDEFGLKQVPVEIAGKEPTARQLVELISRARKMRVRVIFVQPQFSEKSAAAIAEGIDGVVVPLDPLARDYLGNLRQMATKIKGALREQKAP